jgi:hypothetical protein
MDWDEGRPSRNEAGERRIQEAANSDRNELVVRKHRTLYVFWIAIIVAIVVPWSSFQDHAHWQRVGWMPFVNLPDIVLNFLLFLPFGYWRTKAVGGTWRSTTMIALGLSVGAEFAQVFSHGRYPSLTDVACNTAGAICGVAWGRNWTRGTGRIGRLSGDPVHHVLEQNGRN